MFAYLVSAFDSPGDATLVEEDFVDAAVQHKGAAVDGTQTRETLGKTYTHTHSFIQIHTYSYIFIHIHIYTN